MLLLAAVRGSDQVAVAFAPVRVPLPVRVSIPPKPPVTPALVPLKPLGSDPVKIGRASCRGRVLLAAAAVLPVSEMQPDRVKVSLATPPVRSAAVVTVTLEE